MEESMRQRRFGSVVRISVNDAMPLAIRDLLIENLEVDRNDVYAVNGPLGLASLMSLYSMVDRHDLKDPPFIATVPAVLGDKSVDENIFATLRREDGLVHHPYDSFAPVVDFLRSAPHDPEALALKQTLYLGGRNAAVV